MTPAGAALLDTSILIALTQRGFSHFDLGDYERLYISSVSYAELRRGVASAQTAESAMSRAATLEEITSIFGEGLPFDDDAAGHYGRILQTVVQSKGQPRAHISDRMIAAIAASNSLALLTLNGADLLGLEAHLTVIHPSEAGR